MESPTAMVGCTTQSLRIPILDAQRTSLSWHGAPMESSLLNQWLRDLVKDSGFLCIVINKTGKDLLE